MISAGDASAGWTTRTNERMTEAAAKARSKAEGTGHVDRGLGEDDRHLEQQRRNVGENLTELERELIDRQREIEQAHRCRSTPPSKVSSSCTRSMQTAQSCGSRGVETRALPAFERWEDLRQLGSGGYRRGSKVTRSCRSRRLKSGTQSEQRTVRPVCSWPSQPRAAALCAPPGPFRQMELSCESDVLTVRLMKPELAGCARWTRT